MKNSLLYLRENLMWTSTGTVWAMWRVHGPPYGFGKGEHKERAMLAHQALFQGLRGEAMLMGLCAELDPAAVVERMLDGVDLEQCPNYLEEVELSLDELETIPVGERAYWLAVPAPSKSITDRLQTLIRSVDGSRASAWPCPPGDPRRRRSRLWGARPSTSAGPSPPPSRPSPPLRPRSPGSTPTPRAGAWDRIPLRPPAGRTCRRSPPGRAFPSRLWTRAASPTSAPRNG